MYVYNYICTYTCLFLFASGPILTTYIYIYKHNPQTDPHTSSPSPIIPLTPPPSPHHPPGTSSLPSSTTALNNPSTVPLPVPLLTTTLKNFPLPSPPPRSAPASTSA